MKNRLNIIQINGLSGMFLIVLLIGCLVEGVIIFPSKVFMHLWNFIAIYVDNMPSMSLIHGFMLWAIVALSVYAILKDKSPITYHAPKMATEEEIKEMLEQARKMDKMSSILKEDKSEQEIKH